MTTKNRVRWRIKFYHAFALGNVQLIDWTVGYLEIVAYQGFSDEFLHCFWRVSQLDGSACGRAHLGK